MLAANYCRTGPAAEVLLVTEMPVPVPGFGEVLVRVEGSGINPADVKRRAGWRRSAMDHPLIIPHSDGAGEIVAVGEAVEPSRVGERVWLWNAQGSYGAPGRVFGTAAEFIAIASRQAVPLADNFSYEQGAKLGVPAMTAYRAVFSDGSVANQIILINGAAGVVGDFAVQIAAAGGAKVIGTVGSAEAKAQVLGAGAFATINRNIEDVAGRVMELIG